eukprot:3819531-Prymnesium_polylepis.1
MRCVYSTRVCTTRARVLTGRQRSRHPVGQDPLGRRAVVHCAQHGARDVVVRRVAVARDG